MSKKPKLFKGSKPSSFYNEAYYLRGEGSNYGRKDKDGKLVYAPYDEQTYLPLNRRLAEFFVSTYKPKSALVLGCARAYLVQALRELGVDAKGIDISEWAIENAPSKLKEHLYVGDICDLSNFKKDQFDLVTAFDVFEHITVPDLYQALNEASRVCRETLVVDVPIEKDDLHPDQSAGTDKSHVSVYSEGFWIKQFSCRDFRLDAKDVYSYPEGNQGATLIFRKTTAYKKLKLPRCTAEKQPVAILMLNWNGLRFTPKAVDSLYRNTDYPFTLTVVDNQSTDGSAEWLSFASKSYPNMNVVLLDRLNTGYADGNNIGLKFLKERGCESPYVLLLNNDTVFLQRDWLTQLVNVLEKDLDAGVVAPKLLYPDGRIQFGGASFTADLQPYHIGRYKKADSSTKERAVPWVTFACALIRKELLQNGLDDNYKLGTFEDVDFCTKARFLGYKIMYQPQASIYHYEGASVFTVNRTHYIQQQQANGELFYGRWRDWLRMNRNAHPEVYLEDA